MLSLMNTLAASTELSAESHILKYKLGEVAGIEVTNHHLMACVAAVIGLVVFILLATKMRHRAEEGAAGYAPKGVFQNFMEMLLLYLRDETARPLLHDKTDRYIGVLNAAGSYADEKLLKPLEDVVDKTLAMDKVLVVPAIEAYGTVQSLDVVDQLVKWLTIASPSTQPKNVNTKEAYAAGKQAIVSTLAA